MELLKGFYIQTEIVLKKMIETSEENPSTRRVLGVV